MKKLLYLATLSLVATLLFASMAAAQEDPCPDPDFPRQTPDGCQASDLPDVGPPSSQRNTPEPAPETPTAPETQYETPQPPVTPQAQTPPAPETSPETGTDTVLPDTGGASLLMPAAGLLLATGLVGLTVLRRRS